MFIIFFIGSIAETNRAPFDLAEAESELVSGFMTEHAAVIFVFFFLAEYASIVLICILNVLLFLGGYLCLPFTTDTNLLTFLGIDFTHYSAYEYSLYNSYKETLGVGSPENMSLLEGFISSLTLGIKSCIMIFIFI